MDNWDVNGYDEGVKEGGLLINYASYSTQDKLDNIGYLEVLLLKDQRSSMEEDHKIKDKDHVDLMGLE